MAQRCRPSQVEDSVLLRAMRRRMPCWQIRRHGLRWERIGGAAHQGLECLAVMEVRAGSADREDR